MSGPYDQEEFFQAYAHMPRSREGLAAAGEWTQLEPLFPPLAGKGVLDLGCGYGWHCRYAAQKGAARVLGLDSSQRMLQEARSRTGEGRIEYRLCPLEEYEYPRETWDLVFSNLALHYVADLDGIFRRVWQTLRPGGSFLFNTEHPVYTAGIRQDWLYRDDGTPLCWPVDNYFHAGPRETRFLDCPVEKQHHTLTQILMGLLTCGFLLEVVEEVQPPLSWLDQPGMADELRRPMMLLVRARKPVPS